jgi:hypothetical protein
MTASRDHTGWQLPEAQQNYAAQFFSPAEYEMVGTITELIIPTTDTPGAKAAGVPQYLDTLLGETQRWDSSAQQPARFKAGLEWLSKHIQEAHQTTFAQLTPDEQTTVLEQMSESPEGDPGRAFFDLIKNSTVFAYYTSKVGMVDEWHYQMDYRDSYPGCTHTEHQQ